jgi:hypothetical protein
MVLAGSCLGGGGVGKQLVQQLLPFARQHAEVEWGDLQGFGARLVRAEGRVVGGEGVLAPWDVAYTSMRLVSGWGCCLWSLSKPTLAACVPHTKRRVHLCLLCVAP